MDPAAESWGIAWVVVTGASRGFGAAICEGVAAILKPGSRLVGIARSKEGLQRTEAKVNEINPKVKFLPVVLDLGNATKEDMEKALKNSLQDESGCPAPSKAVIFHNAGSLGNPDYLRNQKDLKHASEYFHLNISSVVTLNMLFLATIRSRHPSAELAVVHISSLCAVQPFKSWGLYCAGKAGRDMLFKVLAEEEPEVLVLSYAPGPLDNDMQEIARTATADDELRAIFVSMQKEGKLLSCNKSVSKMLEVLKQRKFKSGDHVDYFDTLE